MRTALELAKKHVQILFKGIAGTGRRVFLLKKQMLLLGIGSSSTFVSSRFTGLVYHEEVNVCRVFTDKSLTRPPSKWITKGANEPCGVFAGIEHNGATRFIGINKRCNGRAIC